MKTRDQTQGVNVNVIDLGSEEVEGVVDFEEDIVPLRVGLGTGDVSKSEQYSDIPKVSELSYFVPCSQRPLWCSTILSISVCSYLLASLFLFANLPC